MKWSIQNNVAIGFVFISAIMAVMGWALYSNLNGLAVTRQKVDHTHLVLETVQDIWMELKDIETGQRGYLIAGDAAFLKPYNRGIRDIHDNLRQLRKLTEDNPSQRERMDLLEPLVQDRIANVHKTIRIRETKGFAEAQLLVQSGEGRLLMNSIERILRQMKTEELSLLRRRDVAMKRSLFNTTVITTIGAVFVLGLLILVYYLINREIENRSEIERGLMRLRDEAQRASRLKSEFLANMSHEIRTPMNGILGMTEIALNTELTGEQRKYLEMVQSSGKTLLTVINDILDFSKIESGKMELDNEPFRLRDNLAQTMHLFSQKAAEKKLELLYHVRFDVPDGLIGDWPRLQQIVTNLVGNALKFTERGEVFLNVALESEAEDGVFLHFKVIDTGIGLTEEQQRRIFEPFTQADGTTSRKFGGTGLGLSITGQLVGMMGGQLWLESEPGKGSTFHFTVRLQIGNGSEKSIVPVALEKLYGMPVLVVDDNATNREILKEFLLGWQMQPTLVENGERALELMRQAVALNNPFRLVLLDAGMPGMDGFMVAETLKQDAALSRTKTVMLTSYGQLGDTNRCKELGLDGYLIKPIGQSELLRAIRTVFGYEITETDLQIEEVGLASPLPGGGLRILLAEDNPINQAVASNILNKKGHEVVIANNGQEALERAALSAFDLILMDVQMPEMDGLEATRRIREKEAASGTRRHVPIIALTASAIKGDRERCLEAGMDYYVSKPFQQQDLLDAVEVMRPLVVNAQPKPGTADRELPPLNGSVRHSAKDDEPLSLDRQRLMERLDGNSALLQSIIQLFHDTLPVHLANLEEAIQTGDAARLEKDAHALKGAIGNFTGESPYEAALALEAIGRENRMMDAEPAYARLSTEVRRLEQALDRLAPVAAEESLTEPGGWGYSASAAANKEG